MSASFHNRSELAAALTHQTMYLMAMSFLFGCLCTIFLLLILDMVRAARMEMMQAEAERRLEEDPEQDT